jgi:hypothetical protein
VAQDQDLDVFDYSAAGKQPSQPNTLTEIKYSNRNTMARDHP